jgi:hypothetical protein
MRRSEPTSVDGRFIQQALGGNADYFIYVWGGHIHLTQGAERCGTAATSSRVPSCAVGRPGEYKSTEIQTKDWFTAAQSHGFGDCSNGQSVLS